jgi:hypothetical protein
VANSVAEEHAVRKPYGGSSRLLLGTIVFGRYTKRFLRYCVRSLRADGNLSALGVKPLLFIHTDEKSLPTLTRGLTCLQPIADVHLHPIAKDLTEALRREGNARYVLLGGSELINMKRAYYRGMHFHCLFPDVVYPRGYFRRLEMLIAEGHKVILSHSLNASLEDCGPRLDAGVSPERLTGLALRYMHERQKPFVMNGRSEDNLPIAPHMVYVGRDRVRIAGMHAAAVFLHNEVLAFEGLRLNATLDAQLPRYIPEGTPMYMPQVGDGMTLIELSDRKWKDFYRRSGCSLYEFALRFWVVAEGEQGYADIMGMTTEFPLSVGATSSWKPLERTEIDASLARIRGYVDRIHPDVIRAFDMGGIIEREGLGGPLQLPQDRIKEAVLASRAAS